MSKKKPDPRIPLFRERKEPKNKDKYIYGTENDEEKRNDTFELVFARYLSDSGRNNKKVSTRTLSVLTGISKSEIHYYLHGERRITYELLCAVCIALRLPISRQEHLFHKAHIQFLRLFLFRKSSSVNQERADNIQESMVYQAFD